MTAPVVSAAAEDDGAPPSTAGDIVRDALAAPDGEPERQPEPAQPAASDEQTGQTTLATEAAPEPVVEPPPEPVVKAVSEPVVEPVAEAASEPVVEWVEPAASEESASMASVASMAAMAALLPMAPGVVIDEAPTDMLPALSRSGSLRSSAGPDRIPPLRLSALGGRRGVIPRWAPFGSMAAVVGILALLLVILWPAIAGQAARLRPPDQLPALTERLASATAVTQLEAANAAFGDQSYAVAPVFTAYYAAHTGQDTLGAAITPAFMSNLGETQFFTNGALVSAGQRTADTIASDASDGPGDLAPDLARDGVDDTAYGVIALSLTQELLALGSAAPVGGDDSGATYATLRAAARPDAFLDAPTPSNDDQLIRATGAPEVIVSSDRAFVVEGKRGGKSAGHTVPLALWTYINSADIAPEGWLVAFGEPLTEPLALTATRAGASHHLLVQAFAQVTLIADLDQPDASGAPTIAIQAAGRDYLLTAGGPAVHAIGQPQRWVTVNGALRTEAGARVAAVGLNANSAVTLSGAAQWLAGDLWYAVAWQTPSRAGSAWVDASALTDTPPSAIPVDSFDALSPDLAKYLAGRGDETGVVAYDVTRGVMYTYNSGGRFIMASSAKVPLLVSYLEYIESQRRGPNSYEVSEMTAMIEQSDNNAAQVIYDTVGYDAGQRAHMRGWGITDYVANPYGWGWAEWSPGDMARLLSLLQAGKVLNASDRALALYLMNHVESDQQFGVGDSAPAGATFWMKNGWVPGPDGAWAVNSSGIVKVGGETYIVTVYNGELGSFQQGIDIVNHVCGAIGQALK